MPDERKTQGSSQPNPQDNPHAKGGNCQNCGNPLTGHQQKWCSKRCLDRGQRDNRKARKARKCADDGTSTKSAKGQKPNNWVRSGKAAYTNLKKRCEDSSYIVFWKYGAKGIENRLSIEEFAEEFLEPNNCQFCGVKFDDENRLSPAGRTTDRKDPDGHYERGNVRVVCRSCNSKRARRGKRRSA